MSYVLDTCAVSELVKTQPDPGFLEWIQHQAADRLFLTSFSLGELRKGIDRLPSGSKKHDLLIWLTRLSDDYANRILDFDSESALLWGALCAALEADGHRMPVLDSLIAACALRHACTLVTRNDKDFRFCGLPLINPWKAG